jgi:hypothetical protein
MQTKTKPGEAANIFRLSDLPSDGDIDAVFFTQDETGRKAAAPLHSHKEQNEPSVKASEIPGDEKDLSPDLASAEPAGSGGALEWLKMMGNATSGLAADIWTPKDDFSARAFPSGEQPASQLRNSASSGNQRHAATSASGDGREEFGEERKLAQKLAYRFDEPRHAPPQSLRAAAMPYVAATGLFVFAAGGALAYFATEWSSDAQPTESQPAASITRLDQSGARKGDFQRAAVQTAPAPSTAQAGRQAELGAPGASQLETWAGTVEAFKQLVKADLQKSAEKVGNAQ